MRFESIVHSLRAWFAERDIPLNGLTLIINMQNKDQAARFDFELNREFGEHTWVPPNFYVDIRKFTFYNSQHIYFVGDKK